MYSEISGILDALKRNAAERTRIWDASENSNDPDADRQLDRLASEATRMLGELNHKDVRSLDEAVSLAGAAAELLDLESHPAGRVLQRALQAIKRYSCHTAPVQ